MEQRDRLDGTWLKRDFSSNVVQATQRRRAELTVVSDGGSWRTAVLRAGDAVQQSQKKTRTSYWGTTRPWRRTFGLEWPRGRPPCSHNPVVVGSNPTRLTTPTS